jgi:hypothetical protein
MSRGDRYFTITGRRVLWRYRRMKGDAIGLAHVNDFLSTFPQEKVLIDARLRGRRRLDTEIHEFLHMANPSMDETYVNRQATDLAKILWALGYRRSFQ